MSLVREWWEQRSSEADRASVLLRLDIHPAYAGLPWQFLTQGIRDRLERRVVIDPRAQTGARTHEHPSGRYE